MGHSFKVKIWSIRQRTDRNQQSAELRWTVGEQTHSATFRTVTLADNRRSELMVAVQRGEAFDEATGLPLSELRRRNDVAWYQHAREYIDMKWADSPASTRRTLAEAMATVTPVLVTDTRGMADKSTVRTALYSWAFNQHRWDQDPPEELQKVLVWFERKSLPISALTDPLVTRKALDGLKRRLDGTTAASISIRRKRAIFYNALEYAIEAGRLAENPIHKVKWSLPDPVDEVLDPATVPNPKLARELLSAVRAQGARGRRLHAFFGCLYYGTARPAEGVGLDRAGCRSLPKRGWGLLAYQRTRPRVGAAWTNSGQAHDDRGLKKRSRKAVRLVPIPPELVAMLRWHIEAYGFAPDGRLFRTNRNGLLQDTGYGEVWERARRAVLPPHLLDTDLAKGPSSLRPAGLSGQLSAGVAPQTVAQRAGHSVEVLLRVYARFIHDTDEDANRRIGEWLQRWS
ncbi:site-specific integrase [Streptomyces sp. XM4011]|uniref:site-specific integrase n=1 Tax=Streptomyces sp. XM4011 TaxID=2929780 RepID=UPI001FF804B9|nr:site-specific integrase [Streptomyces sp. XM4011]MCK1812720.1 site-specific integrase [Streptomyces sp. XM4011]